MHTSESSDCGQSTAIEQVRAYKKAGYAGIIITDHFLNGNSSCPRGLQWQDAMRYVCAGYAAAKVEGDKLGIDVFFGWEFGGRGKEQGTELLTYGLDISFLLAHPGLDSMPHAQYCQLVRESGGFIAQAHPYRARSYIANPMPVSPSLVDALEVYNGGDQAEANSRALEFAKTHNMPMQAGSDSHSALGVKRCGIRLASKASTIFDIIRAIKGFEVELVC